MYLKFNDEIIRADTIIYCKIEKVLGSQLKAKYTVMIKCENRKRQFGYGFETEEKARDFYNTLLRSLPYTNIENIPSDESMRFIG